MITAVHRLKRSSIDYKTALVHADFMNFHRKIIFVSLTLAALVLLLPVVWPQIDLAVSGVFYLPGKGFFLAENPLLLFLHEVARYGAWILIAYLALAVTVAFLRHAPFLGIDAKGWMFLALGLLIGPALVANVIFKDHWGRARPREVTEFGGHAAFSPALIPQPEAHRNGSFVAGDAAFGFYIPSFAYVVPKRRSRHVFQIGMGFGLLLGFTRIAMGAHFLSDVAFAALFMLVVSVGLHAAMFGKRNTALFWRDWFYFG